MSLSHYKSIIEDAAPEGFEELGYVVGHGPNLAPDEPAESKRSLGILLVWRPCEAIYKVKSFFLLRSSITLAVMQPELLCE